MSTVTVKMISTAIGADDGIFSKKYIKDYVYELSVELADCFLKMGVARAAKANEKVNGKGKAINERDILNKQMKEFENKDAADQLKNKADENKEEAD